ncbi:MAG TPA: GNAT family N-acetyltransferase [Candidatus Limnocylindria bacterium]|nr:GNAT family N-acetyltransferase [Candidatus Limnocylindria bacterium]
MVPSPRAGEMVVDRLGPPDLVETFGFLDHDPVLNVYLLALTLRDSLAATRDEYWVARREGEIAGLLHLGGQSGAVLPLGDDEAAMRLLADQARARLGFLPRRFQIIGPTASVAPFLQRFARSGFQPRLERSQVYMSLDPADLATGERLPELEPARRDDFDLVYVSGAQLRAEELDEDPRDVDPAGYRRRVEEECRDSHTYLWKDARGDLRFRASVSAITADAAQISGVYTPPEHRNRGNARRGLAELCLRLFERSRSACLFVNDFNHSALAVYRRLGFRERAPWRSAFYDTPR